MPRLINSSPRYCRHRMSGQAVVTIDGRDFYPGVWNSKASKIEYERLIGLWLAGGRRLPDVGNADLTVTEVVAGFWEHAKTYYRHIDGSSTSENPIL